MGLLGPALFGIKHVLSFFSNVFSGKALTAFLVAAARTVVFRQVNLVLVRLRVHCLLSTL